jgi:hypothetical protein
MKQTLIKKYRDYCKARDTRDDILKMIQGGNESLEDNEEIFQLSYKRAHNYTLDENSFKIVLLRGVREEFTKTLNLLANIDFSELEYEDIK